LLKPSMVLNEEPIPLERVRDLQVPRTEDRGKQPRLSPRFFSLAAAMTLYPPAPVILFTSVDDQAPLFLVFLPPSSLFSSSSSSSLFLIHIALFPSPLFLLLLHTHTHTHTQRHLVSYAVSPWHEPSYIPSFSTAYLQPLPPSLPPTCPNPLQQKVDALSRTLVGGQGRRDGRVVQGGERGLDHVLCADGFDAEAGTHKKQKLSRRAVLDKFGDVVSKLDEVSSLAMIPPRTRTHMHLRMHIHMKMHGNSLRPPRHLSPKKTRSESLSLSPPSPVSHAAPPLTLQVTRKSSELFGPFGSAVVVPRELTAIPTEIPDSMVAINLPDVNEHNARLKRKAMSTGNSEAEVRNTDSPRLKPYAAILYGGGVRSKNLLRTYRPRAPGCPPPPPCPTSSTGAPSWPRTRLYPTSQRSDWMMFRVCVYFWGVGWAV